MLKLVDGVVGAGGVSVAGLVVQESVSEQEDAITQSLLMEGSLVGVKVRNSNSVTYTGFTLYLFVVYLLIFNITRCINGGDFRAQQCENEFFIAAPGTKGEAGHSWIPFEHNDNEFKCKLACYNRNTKVKH